MNTPKGVIIIDDNTCVKELVNLLHDKLDDIVVVDKKSRNIHLLGADLEDDKVKEIINSDIKIHVFGGQPIKPPQALLDAYFQISGKKSLLNAINNGIDQTPFYQQKNQEKMRSQKANAIYKRNKRGY